MNQYWDSHPGKSLTFLRFKRCHTDLNNIYWGLKLNRIMACKYSIPVKEYDEIKAFKIVPNVEERRYPKLFGDWQKGISSNESWVRKNVLVSANAYLEKYIHEITTFSILSDPGVLINASKRIDGLFFLKRDILPRGIEAVEMFTVGDWYKRIAALQKTFKGLTDLGAGSISELEKIRKLRNKIAHRFGYDFTDRPPHLHDAVNGSESISEKNLMKCLSLIESIAISLDEYLMPNHIGYFEYLYFWHNWDKKNIPVHLDEDYRKLKHGIGAVAKLKPVSKDISKKLIQIYTNAK